MTHELKALAIYCLTVSMIVVGAGLFAKQVLDDLAQPASASEARKPEISPRIAAWMEREAEDAHFTQLRRKRAERERREWQQRQRVIARRPAAPVPRTRIIESASRRNLDLSSRQRSQPARRMAADDVRERDIEPAAPAYVGGLTATHAAMRDRSGN